MSLATGLLIFAILPVVVAIAAVPALRGSIGRVLKEPAFLVALGLLGVAAVGLNAATRAMELHFKKQAVDLSVPRLDDAKQGIPSRLGNWVQVTIDEPLDHGLQEVLGTKEFVFRDYVDSRFVPQSDIDWFTDKSSDERRGRLSQIQAQRPEAVIRVAVTYYTGLVDTVPHIPEKCYVADGFVPSVAPDTRSENLGTRPDGSPRTVSYRSLHFEDGTDKGRVDRDVAYLFHVNGRYESSNIGVRRELQDLRQRYGYFAKVELMTQAQSRSKSSPEIKAAAQAKSQAAFNDLLTVLLPELERCLPDWNKVTAGTK